MKLHATPFGVELHRSCCLCYPGRSEALQAKQGGHMCVHGAGGLWLRHGGAWWRLREKSAHRVRQWLEVCDDWDDVVLALEPFRPDCD